MKHSKLKKIKKKEEEIDLFRNFKKNKREGDTRQFYIRVKEQANKCDFHTRTELKIKQ